MLADSLLTFPPKAQEEVLKIFTICMIRKPADGEGDDRVACLSDICPGLVSLISSPQEAIQEATLSLLSQLTRTEPHKSSITTSSCLARLLECTESKNVNISLLSLTIISDCWCNDVDSSELASVGKDLNVFTPLLSSPEDAIVGRAVYVLESLSTFGEPNF